MLTLKETLLNIADKSPTAWVYLPADKNWNLNSKCAVLESEEVPPELENDPEAGVPEVAKKNNLIQALPVTVVQDVVANAKAQKPSVTLNDIFRAFVYYFKHDAFRDLTR
jgi:hypothetical protein